MPLVRKPSGASPPTAQPRPQSEGLDSKQVDERWAAARATADTPEGVAALIAALGRETDAHVREVMFTSLAKMATPEAAEHVLLLLRSNDAKLRTGALDALRIMIRDMPQVLSRLLGDADVDVRILSCELARHLSTAEASSSLCALLAGEPDENVCAAAIDVLAEVGGAAAIPALEQCAARFRHSPFVGFAARIAIDRISSQKQPCA